MGKQPKSIIEMTRFQADPDSEYIIQISQLLLLYPFFRWTDGHFIDATGDFDLCMSEDGTRYTFINRRPTTEIFAYRYIPAERIRIPLR